MPSVPTRSVVIGCSNVFIGGALALAAWTDFTRAAQTLKSEGSFAGLARLVPYADINELFTTDYRARARLTDCDRRDQHEYNGRSSE
jgi:hypothetical protein